ATAGWHAKAVELLGTYLVRFHGARAAAHQGLVKPSAAEGFSDEEESVARVLTTYQDALTTAARDILGLATAFREPPTEGRLLEYLASPPVQALLHQTWGRSYPQFPDQPPGWLAAQVQELVALRLLERVASGRADGAAALVIDAHPLVRRGFEGVLGAAGQRQSAQARAGFLRGRPDRRPPATLEEARAEVELFHAYCDAGLWNEADS